MHTFCANPFKLYVWCFLTFINREDNMGINLKKKYYLLTLMIIVCKEDELILPILKIQICTIKKSFSFSLPRENGKQP